MDIARGFLISGRVQGVGFRYFVQEVGQREGLIGWVRNLHDGRVEAFAQGEHEAVARFEARLRIGPAMARVGGVDVREERPVAITGFEVRASL